MFDSSCDLAKSYLAKGGATYANIAAPAGSIAEVRIGDTVVASFDGAALPRAEFATRKTKWEASLGAALASAGYPAKADSALVDKPRVVAIRFLLVMYVTMVYGPTAAALVEMFPTNIRYTSMSLPYHIGNGWFGGFLPTTAPDAFWSEQARRLDWTIAPTRIKDVSFDRADFRIRWFEDGVLNVAWNCLDRHLAEGGATRQRSSGRVMSQAGPAV